MAEPLTPATAIPLMHRFLGIGLMLVTAAFIGIRLAGVAPQQADPAVTEVLAAVMTGVSGLLTAVAVVFVRRRVPARTLGQSVDAYWSTPAIGARALALWGLLEAAGLIAGVGYFLTGALLCAFAAAVAIVLFRWCGPDALARP